MSDTSYPASVAVYRIPSVLTPLRRNLSRLYFRAIPIADPADKLRRSAHHCCFPDIHFQFDFDGISPDPLESPGPEDASAVRGKKTLGCEARPAVPFHSRTLVLFSPFFARFVEHVAVLQVEKARRPELELRGSMAPWSMRRDSCRLIVQRICPHLPPDRRLSACPPCP